MMNVQQVGAIPLPLYFYLFICGVLFALQFVFALVILIEEK